MDQGEWSGALVPKLAEYGLEDIPPEGCLLQRFRGGETVIREGMPLSWLGVIVSGRAKVCYTAPNGKSLLLSYYLSQGLLGDIEFMSGMETATSTLVAVTDFECIVIPHARIAGQLRENVKFLNAVGRSLADMLIRSSNNYAMASLYSGEERLCAYVLQGAHDGMFTDILTDVASSVGMSYRHMFRLLGALCREGILEKRQSGYRILDAGRLRLRAADFRAEGESGK